MPANICVPLFKGGEKNVTVRTTAAVVGKTFGSISANIQSGPELTVATLPATYDGGNFQAATCGTGLKPDGVFAYDVVSGDVVPLIRQQGGAIVPVTSGAAITAGAEVEVGAAGKVITLATGKVAGKATTTAAGANVDCYVELY